MLYIWTMMLYAWLSECIASTVLSEGSVCVITTIQVTSFLFISQNQQPARTRKGYCHIKLCWSQTVGSEDCLKPKASWKLKCLKSSMCGILQSSMGKKQNDAAVISASQFCLQQWKGDLEEREDHRCSYGALSRWHTGSWHFDHQGGL